MANEVCTLTVVLDGKFYDEEHSIGVLKNAIRMLKGVESVHTGQIRDIEQVIANANFRTEVGGMIATLAVGSDPEFLRDVKGACEKLRMRRGY